VQQAKRGERKEHYQKKREKSGGIQIGLLCKKNALWTRSRGPLVKLEQNTRRFSKAKGEGFRGRKKKGKDSMNGKKGKKTERFFLWIFHAKQKAPRVESTTIIANNVWRGKRKKQKSFKAKLRNLTQGAGNLEVERWRERPKRERSQARG